MWLVKQLQLSERLQDIEFTTTNECLYFLVDLVSNRTFFLSHPQVLSSEMFVWFLRQTGLTQSCITFDRVFDLCKKYRSISGDDEAIWESHRLPLVLKQVVHALKVLETAPMLDSHKASESRQFTFLALHMPSIIFAFSYNVPSLLNELYSPKGIRCIRDIHAEIMRIFKHCHIAEYVFQEANAIPCKKPEYLLTYRSFLKLTQDVGLLHDIIPLQVFQNAFEYLFEHSNYETFYISMGDILEIIFVLSQILFNIDISGFKNGESQRLDISHGGKSLYSTDPLDCFRSFTLLYDESISLMLEGDDVRQSYLSDVSLHFTNSFFHASDLNMFRQRRQSSWSDEGSVPSEVSSTIYQGPSQVDLLLIILHYPHNSVHFNPWRVHGIYSRHIHLDSFRSNQMNDSRIVFDLLEDIIREYQIDRESFVSYFGKLYVGKQHLPHLLRREVKESLRSAEVF